MSEVAFCVPIGADVSVVRADYSDLYQDEGWEDHDRYYIGDDDDEEGLSYDAAVAFCGFAEGAVEGSNCLIEGNGAWAQGMLRETDFSGLRCAAARRAEMARLSGLYWAAHRKGRAAAEGGGQ